MQRIFLNISIAAVVSVIVFYVLFETKKDQLQQIPKVGLVNMTRVRSESKAFQDLQKEIDAAYENAKHESQKLEESLKKEARELKLKQSAKENAEKLNKMKQNLEKKVGEIEQKVQEKRLNLHKTFQQKTQELETKLEGIIRQYTKDQKINLLLNTQANDAEIALTADDHMNHTNNIIEIFNREYNQ